ncbi:30S ribosomal protein S12 methylthiotransferase RimO [Acetonema longum]|uniref:Ribosomal protein uS12 methylthiotransferase RimO n=1 Tax=Acetonema longum DSM 6540 TaxID=1009370 RepID=F7NPE5_9FIRM|nr:30S ribosomal protein S12 methylthiotransferase RimO [Acetonema longum]EGO62107.1 MiaB-like tRNA modifying enzyme YliG [Acetonema longum DSM 6540]
MRAGFISLGCAKNLVDTEIMLGLLDKAGINITDDPAEAEILIVNTCSFIDSAKEESISVILQMAAYKKTGHCRCLIVAGCLGQRYQGELLDELPEVDAILGTGAWHRVVEAIEVVLQKKERLLLTGEDPAIYDETMPRITTTPSHTAYVKIAEGCSNCCSFCVIPMVRGAFRSRTAASVVNEVKQLAARGVKEINLIAQDTTSYGRDLYDGPKLTGLLKELVRIDGIAWIRILYCYPKYFTDDLIDLIAKEPKICKYIDLPLQHIDDSILQVMNRPDNQNEIEVLLAKIRSRIPGVAVRTSFIVGFPGETEQQFQNLRNFISEQRFEHVGIFTYSQEEGTVAAALEDQIADETKQERYHELMAIQSQISEQINQSMEMQILDVLIEGATEQDRVMMGRSYREAPDVDGHIYIESASALPAGEFVKVRIVQGFAYDLLGEKL